MMGISNKFYKTYTGNMEVISCTLDMDNTSRYARFETIFSA
jgi:hypothetical protein